MNFDLIVREARLAHAPEWCDIGVRNGRIAAIAPQLPQTGPDMALGGKLVIPGFVETHIHLDKSCLLERTGCSHVDLPAAVKAVAAIKQDLTAEDIVKRSSRTLRTAIACGTNLVRAHVEVDPRIGLRGLEAMLHIQREYRWAADVQLCVFPQEGLTNDPGCEALLVEALTRGGQVIGGAPYTDSNPSAQLQRIFELAQEFDVDIDLHLDFDLDPSWSSFDEVCRLTDHYAWGGRVAVGHVSKLAVMAPDALAVVTRRMAGAGVAVTALPATDLFLLGRGLGTSAPRPVLPLTTLSDAGVNCSISTNNVLNPFTPFGDCSLPRIANLHANVGQMDTDSDMRLLFDAVTTRAARLLNAEQHRIAEGLPATFVVLDCASPEQALREIKQPLFGVKDGRRSFTRPAATLHPPGGLDERLD